VRGSRIYEDANGHVRLDDLWKAAKVSASKQPKHWRATVVLGGGRRWCFSIPCKSIGAGAKCWEAIN
jgi:hypothetical protein